MIEAIIVKGHERIEEVFSIKKRVYDEEGLLCDINREIDGNTFNVIVYEDNIGVATGSLCISNSEIGDICVIKERRANYFGDLVVKMLIDKAFREGKDIVYVNALIQLVKFYEKIGFKTCFEEDSEINNKTIRMYIDEKAIIKCKH